MLGLKRWIAVRSVRFLLRLDNRWYALFWQFSSISVCKKWWYRLVEKFCFRLADAAVVATRDDLEYVLERHGVIAEKAYLIPNYIDVARFAPVSERDKDDAADVLLYVGRLEPQKNLHALVEAMAGTRWKLHVYGEGSLRESLETLAADGSVEVRFFGRVSNEELARRMGGYRYFVLPSLYEGLPKALLEAMACGLVCLCTPVAGIRNLVEDGVTAVVTSGTDVLSLRDGLDRLASADWRRISSAARRFIEKHFSLESVAGREAALYGKLKRRME